MLIEAMCIAMGLAIATYPLELLNLKLCRLLQIRWTSRHLIGRQINLGRDL